MFFSTLTPKEKKVIAADMFNSFNSERTEYDVFSINFN